LAPSSSALRVQVHDAAVSVAGGYVYGIVAPAFGCAYVGQTVGYQGAIGRLAQHLSFGAGNTFRQRVSQIYAVEEPEIGAVEFAAVRLTSRRAFHDRASDYREAVEALTQYELIRIISDEQLGVGVISRVSLNRYVRLGYVMREASAVADALARWLRSVNAASS
jgi:hypothetical protein